MKRWEADALKVQLAFMRHFGMAERPVWDARDGEELEAWCNALMQSMSQMDAGQRGKAGSVDFGDLPTIQNAICVMACRLVLSGALARLGGGEAVA